MPFDGVDHKTSAILYPHSHHPDAPVTPLAMFTALTSAYMISRRKTAICHHTFRPGFKWIDASDYAISSTTYVDLLRVQVALPDHVTHISYKALVAVIPLADNETFTWQIEVDDSSNQDTEPAQSRTVENITSMQSRAEAAFNAGNFLFEDLYDAAKFIEIEGEVEISTVSLPADVEIALYGKTGDANSKMRPGFIQIFWEVRD